MALLWWIGNSATSSSGSNRTQNKWQPYRQLLLWDSRNHYVVGRMRVRACVRFRGNG